MTPVQMRAIRMGLGLSQTDMAKVLCISRNSLGRYETGEQPPSKLVSLCYAELRSGWVPSTLVEVRRRMEAKRIKR